jgi:hypothetical protein
MALNWNIEKCQNFEELKTDKEWPVTDILIWATMIVSIGTITEKNYKEFYARLHLVEKLSGSLTSVNGKENYITLEQVKRRIGLQTNVSTIPRSTFLKQKVGRYFKEITESGTQE